MTVVLEVEGLTCGYGPVPVVHDLSFTVEAGEVVALLGANGAGKTTTMLSLAGILPAIGGAVRFDGAPLRGPLHTRARRGLAFITEERSVFGGLSTRANLELGRGSVAAALELFPELEPLLDRPAGLLSGGEQQMLTLARALAATPKLLMIDELSLGLAPLIVRRLLDQVRHAADSGTGVLLVEQHARQALRVADRAYILRRGRVELAGTGADLDGRLDEIERAYLHGEPSGAAPLTQHE